MTVSAAVTTRDSYQEKRLASLASHVMIKASIGLEIGACNKPTVPANAGVCRFADFRSAKDMVDLWGLDPATVCDVDYILARSACISEQIPGKFDYIIACHVIEHVPDPIGYLHGLAKLLNPGGIIMLAVPDKRVTFDLHRPLTTIDHLLMDFYDKCRYPSIEHIVEFHRYAVAFETGADVPVAESFAFAKSNFESGMADSHCHVWDDATFHSQFAYLSDAGLLGGLALAGFEATPEGFNECTAVFKRQA
jgi:SAM-dependent methyltransferase